MSNTRPSFSYERFLDVDGRRYRYVALVAVDGIDRAPIAIRILVENVMRCARTEEEGMALARSMLDAASGEREAGEIPFMPARVLFQDFTGVPVFVDFAAMRDAAHARGEDPTVVNPQIPCTLVIDHSVAADVTSCTEAARENARIESERNRERFSFLKWSSLSFENVEIVPPGRGICHQLNVERFCKVVWSRATAEGDEAYFDTLVGTDSHTTTANGVGVLGWGVGGIEAEAASLGQPITMVVPPVVGMRITGSLRPGVSGMDVALAFASRLRSEGVVGSIVECFGPGVANLTVTQRATIANMTPEYGCTATYFPPDEAVLKQLELYGRDPADIALARAYLTAQGIMDVADELDYQRVIPFDLGLVEPCVAGPSRPHDRVLLGDVPEHVHAALRDHGRAPGHEVFSVEMDGKRGTVTHGAIALAAITSCTTATDPAMMVAAGLVARRACELGCAPIPWIKKVLAPGSHATTDMLARAGLIEPLAQMGFAVCGWGCMSCIGNSGPLTAPMTSIAEDCELVSVLSGNRNFEGRISPLVSQNYLCAPALVVAYSLAGTIDVNLMEEPVCEGANGPVWLRDLMPSDEEVAQIVARALDCDVFDRAALELGCGTKAWNELDPTPSATYAWDEGSTYVRRPPFLDVEGAGARFELNGARALAYLGDFVTTDHISPAGSIASGSPAARYLSGHGIEEAAFNTYGARRGNHEVMMRGTFANVKLCNRLAPEYRGGWTRDPVTGELTTIFEASQSAAAARVPLIVLAGKLYGSGSSRDWAAKGPALLGVRAVIAESFERIHRSNLIGMGIVPLEFEPGTSAEALGLTGEETYRIEPFSISDACEPDARAHITATRASGEVVDFSTIVRIDTQTEAAYVARGGILPYVLDRLLSAPR